MPILLSIIIIITGPCLPVRSGWSQPVGGGGCYGGSGGGVCEEETPEVCSQREDPDLPDSHGDGVSQEHEEERGRGGGGEEHLHQDQRYIFGIFLVVNSTYSRCLFMLIKTAQTNDFLSSVLEDNAGV